MKTNKSSSVVSESNLDTNIDFLGATITTASEQLKYMVQQKYADEYDFMGLFDGLIKRDELAFEVEAISIT